MRPSNIIAAVLFISVTLCGASFAANVVGPQPSPASAKSAPVSTKADCEGVGSDVSALIDSSIESPNISQARAAFELGLMACMEDRPVESIRSYDDAKELLTKDRPGVTIILPKT